MDISVVIPLYNEEESLPELQAWIKRVMEANGFSYEIIFVNDGSTDRSWQVIEELASKYPEVKGIKFRRNYGKSPALFCGFVFFPTNQPEQPETGLSAEWTALVADGVDPFDMYIRNLTDEELEEWMEFSENDIFYELTTENLNEDED